MTQVLAVLGGGPAEAPVIDTAAALAEIAHARVRRVSLAEIDCPVEEVRDFVADERNEPNTTQTCFSRPRSPTVRSRSGLNSPLSTCLAAGPST